MDGLGACGCTSLPHRPSQQQQKRGGGGGKCEVFIKFFIYLFDFLSHRRGAGKEFTKI